ncbi:hypothetical protein IW140_001250 [Coemansia sp. RSA 1813]|nr:hypothetical protein EV178_001160 [Coemansia sp. RSA 1646]KAJ1771734.1 hypothetical protein LPJ74_002036 [Coemansia sp. RSA 1843]KAJ2091699.1 hypothetical protein IW138_001682 [Coemansia sp. RSA 986]KAJ2216898.1 hypothetical protein EV179_000932 [Coemansia sp. RSA 487]KAJ2571901.1 hypothetical protein IW140_001250 [Coemansia sp. RSA 1813]
MDEFKDTVKSQIFSLDGFDQIVSSMYIPCYYWFENTAADTSWIKYMPPEALCYSFYRTLQDFPIIAGRFKTDKDDRGYVEVDKNDLNMPIYTDASWDVEFKKIKDAGFDTKLLPETFQEACSIAAASRFATTSAKLGIFRICRLKDFSGVVILASIAHGIVDGHGHLAFMNRWAEVSRWMQECLAKKELQLPTRTFIHDRSIHKDYRLHGTDALDDMTLRSAYDGSSLTRFFSRLPIDKRNRIFKSISPSKNIVCCNFHVRAEPVKELQESLQEHARHGSRYTTNDVFTALMAMVVSQAIHKNTVSNRNRVVSKMKSSLFGNSNNKADDMLIAVAVNMRSRIDHPSTKDFVGNLSFVRYITCSQALVQAENNLENISAVATNIKDAISTTDKKYIGQLNNLINSESDSHMRLITNCRKYENIITISNVSKASYYEMDFGSGTPSLVRPTFRVTSNSVFIMPCHSDIGGYDFVMALERDVAGVVVQDKHWMRLVDSYDFDI